MLLKYIYWFIYFKCHFRSIFVVNEAGWCYCNLYVRRQRGMLKLHKASSTPSSNLFKRVRIEDCVSLYLRFAVRRFKVLNYILDRICFWIKDDLLAIWLNTQSKWNVFVCCAEEKNKNRFLCCWSISSCQLLCPPFPVYFWWLFIPVFPLPLQ